MKRKRRLKKVVPVLSAAGLLSMMGVGAASAATPPTHYRHHGHHHRWHIAAREQIPTFAPPPHGNFRGFGKAGVGPAEGIQGVNAAERYNKSHGV
jgi:hypothetical protein